MSRSIVLIAALLASAALVALGTYSFHEETARSKPVVLPFEVLWCAEDSDCAVVDRIGCCSCSQGGAQAAVTVWRRDELRRFLKKACEPEQICVQLNLCRSDVEARCVERHCTLVGMHGK
jgi:hypothetical protein